jgi:hypothetical protein
MYARRPFQSEKRMRPAIWIAVVLPLLGLPLAGCRQSQEEKAERGLAVPGETTTPESADAMRETTAERQADLEKKEEAAQEKAFDAENSGEAKQP